MKEAIDLSLARARRDATTPGSPPLPKAIRPLLRFSRLPAKARATFRDVLDNDDDFRARVAEGVIENDLDRASWLFLTRGEGWHDEFTLLREAALEEAAESSASRESQSAQRRLGQVEAALERLKSELSTARELAAESERALAEERSARTAAQNRVRQLESEVVELERGRQRAVHNLKAAKELAGARLGELRSTQEQLAANEKMLAGYVAAHQAPDDEKPPSAPEVENGSSPWADLDPSAVAEAVTSAARAAELMSEALGSAAKLLIPDQPSPPSDADANPDRSAVTPDKQLGDRRPPRRSPVRLVRGANEGSIEAIRQLLDVESMIVVVDGYNVSMEAWPHMDQSGQRRSLMAMLGAVSVRMAADVHIVFDGDDDGSRPSVSAPLPVRLHFSHADVEADDVILDMVARLPTDRPVMVVSSDRRVRDGARRLGANVVRSSELLAFARK